MSKVTKAICDKCKKEINYSDWYYVLGDISSVSQSSAIGSVLLRGGDFCEECFFKILTELKERK